MNILFLTHRIPNPYSGATIRPFYLIKNFSEKYNHNIYLISFVTDSEKEYINKIENYCQELLFIPIKYEKDAKAILLKTLRNNFFSVNIFSKIISDNGVFDPSYYSYGGVQKRIDKFIEQYPIDAIYSDASMAGYVANSSLPKIVEPLDINYKNWFRRFIQKRKFTTKIYWFIRSLQTFYREVRIFKKFDYCIVVTEKDKKYISEHLSNVIVIPNGIDIDYFRPMAIKPNHPSIVFIGAMDGEKNIEAVLYFYSKIYPIVKKEYPEITFYIVGKNPHPKIRELSKDPSVIVTGFVKDVRFYISRASVVVCPIISGSGIKNKVLEAMAMGKPVVSTSIGALGIDVIPRKNILIANNPKDFAQEILNLLSDERLREKIGRSARQLIEKKYSWERIASRLNELFGGLINED